SSRLLSASSSNTNLVPTNNVVFGGSGASRTVTITPATNQNGASTITIGVSDGASSTNTSFVLTVNAVNDAPVLSAIPNLNVTETRTLLYTNVATDVEAPPEILTFTLSNAPAGATING